jgi:hypothetical protein
VNDGRTQDLVGLGLVPKLALEPRAWLIEHSDGLRSAILVLDGAVADFNFAVKARNGTIFSAQLYRPAPPNEHHFSQLASVVEDFFRTGQTPWHLERNLLTVGLLDLFGRVAGQPTSRIETPELAIKYQPVRGAARNLQ